MGLTEAEFQTVLPKLLARGFPRPDPDTSHYDLKAIDVWIDERSGLSLSASQPQSVSTLRERLEARDGGYAGQRDAKTLVGK